MVPADKLPRRLCRGGMDTELSTIAEGIARKQMGLVARFQITGHPRAASFVNSQLRTRRWHEVAPGVYSHPGYPDSWKRALWISYLHAGSSAVVSHQSAGRLLRLTGVERTLSLMVERDHRHVRNRRGSARLHRLVDVAPSDVTMMSGMRATTAPRTLVDLATVVSRQALLHATEDAITRGLTTVAATGAVLERVRRRGKPGVAKMCSVLDQLGPGAAVAASKLDKALTHVINLSGLPTPIAEHPLPTVQCLDGLVDRYLPEALLIVEADGRKWHERRRNMARDRERDVEAARTGHQTVRFMWENLVSDPVGSAAALVEIHEIRLAQLGRNGRDSRR